MRFGLLRVRSPLLTESLLFSLPAGTEMFHFPAFPPHTLCIQMRVTRHHACWVSPFGHPRITARLAAPRGISQPLTSFIGLLMPRHPPCALTTQHTNDQEQPPHTPTPGTHGGELVIKKKSQKNQDARVHYPVLTQHQPPPPTTTPKHEAGNQRQ